MAPLTEVDVTVVGARDLKNVNWKHGELRPYTALWVAAGDGGPDAKIAKVSTEADNANGTDPGWDQRFTLVCPSDLSRADLVVEVLHHDPDALIKKPEKALVGAASLPLSEVADAGGFNETLDFTLPLKRPSGRPQGKLDLAIRLKEKRPVYPAPGQAGYPSYSQYESGPTSRDWAQPYPSPSPYAQAPPSYPPYANPYGSYGQAPSGYGAPPPSGYGGYDGAYGYGQPQSGAYGYGVPQSGPSGYPGPLPTQDPPKKASKFGGLGTGLAVGALAGAVGGLALNEYVEHEENEAREEQAEEDAQDDDGGYGDDY